MLFYLLLPDKRKKVPVLSNLNSQVIVRTRLAEIGAEIESHRHGL